MGELFMIKTSKIIYQDCIYQILVNDNYKRFFIKLNNNGTNDTKDQIMLDRIYNRPYDYSLNSYDKKYVARLFICGVLTLSITNNMLSNCVLVKSPLYKQGIITSTKLIEANDINYSKMIDNVYDDEDIYNVVNNNQNIDESSKKIIFELIESLQRSYPNIDLNILKENLEYLKIKIVSEKEMDEYKGNDSVDAYVNYVYKEIIFSDSIEPYVMKHELGHLLINLYFGDTKEVKRFQQINKDGRDYYSYGSAIEEGCNELLLMEIGNNNAYMFEPTFVKMLCEILGNEKVFDIYTKGNINDLANALSKVKGTKEDALSIILKMDERLESEKANDIKNANMISESICLSLMDYYFSVKKNNNTGDVFTDVIDVLRFKNLLLKIEHYSKYLIEKSKKDNLSEDEMCLISEEPLSGNIKIKYYEFLNNYFSIYKSNYDKPLEEIKGQYSELENDIFMSMISKINTYFTSINQSAPTTNDKVKIK
jgi:hypothetical protein